MGQNSTGHNKKKKKREKGFHSENPFCIFITQKKKRKKEKSSFLIRDKGKDINVCKIFYPFVFV